MEWSIRQYENLEKAMFDGVGKYDIPPLAPVTLEEPVSMVGFNFALTYKQPEKVGLHFFLKDYQFNRLWVAPDKYTGVVGKFRFVCTPDFSMFTDYPLAVQIYSHYKKHWLGAYWQSKGITVVPTICWSDERSFDWCFDGEPAGATVAVSSVGTQMGKGTRQLFLAGYNEMLRRLQPSMILFHGAVPEGCGGNIINVQSYQNKLRKINVGVV